MVALLTSNGAKVTAVSTTREAVAQLNGQVPDLMIADIGLPDQDGYELIRQVRNLDSVVAQGGHDARCFQRNIIGAVQWNPVPFEAQRW